MPNVVRPKFDSVHWPSGGLNRATSYQWQQPYTTPDASNWIPYDVIKSRERGGNRPGFTSYGTAGSGPIRLIGNIRYQSSGTLKTINVAGSGSTLYVDNGSGTWSNQASVHVYQGPTQGCSYRQGYFTAAPNGSSSSLYVYDPNNLNGGTGAVSGDEGLIDPTGDGTQTYTALGHTAPDPPDHCTIVTRWADRIVMSGNATDPLEVWMSHTGDARDWRYAFTGDDGSALILGNSPNAGQLGDIITALISHTDQCLIFGCRQTMSILRGNPNTAGTLTTIIDGVGCLTPTSWCYDDRGFMYWLSKDGLWALTPGCDGEVFPVSRRYLPKDLVGIDETAYYCSLAYDRRFRGLHICVNPTSAGTAQNYFCAFKTSLSQDNPNDASFWPVEYGTYLPTVVADRGYYTSSASDQSPVLFGGSAGVMQFWDNAVACERSSYCDIGPIPLAPPGYDGLLHEFDCVPAQSSGTMSVAVRVGATAEQAYAASTFGSSYSFAAGLNRKARPRARGQSVVFRLSAAQDVKVALEEFTIRRAPSGRRRYK